MKREKQEELEKRFPDLFGNVHKSPKASAMCFGIETGDGWFNLIEEVCEKLDTVAKVEDIQVHFMQIKEKYGGLVIYVNNYVDAVDSILSDAEDRSYHVCELCGDTETAKVRGTRWVQTLCDRCVNKEG